MSIFSNRKFFYINLIIIISIFILDRVTKLYVIYLDKINSGSEIYLSKYLNIYLIWNEGIAFGLFSFDEKNLYNYLTIFILIIVVFILFWIIKSKGIQKYALSMISGGALGNLFDRILYRAVPDFIDLHINNFHWFIFNIADIFITIGVFLMILSEFTVKDRNEKT
ncbi:signal peptidase II [Pelagibacterales bacterium SAG-MED44]|jgi:signal peptidase II|nr:signal peptidase II [Pelagibacterales bacterium SAG-MED44]